MKQKLIVTSKGEKIEIPDIAQIYIWNNWVEVKPKGKDRIDIELKRGMEITIKCT